MDNFVGSVLVVTIAFLSFVFGVLIGMDVNTTHDTPSLVTPDITITNVGGVVDTTYTYNFATFDSLNK